MKEFKIIIQNDNKIISDKWYSSDYVTIKLILLLYSVAKLFDYEFNIVEYR